MLITKQLKKSNNNIRYSISNQPPISVKPAGTKIKKNKVIKEPKLHKNLSQLPIYIDSQLKENDSASMANIMLGKGYSSLVASDVSGSLSKSRNKKDRDTVIKARYELFDNDKTTNIRNEIQERNLVKKANPKKNTISKEEASIIPNKRYSSIVPSNKIKNRRLSGMSRSNSKWNNRSVEEELSVIKSRINENRKKYNLSCGDMIDKRSKSKSKSKDQSRVKKKKSTLNATKMHNLIDGNKENCKDKSGKKKKNDKSKTKFKKVSMGGVIKSKGSTSFIQTNKINLGKNRQKQAKQKDHKQKQRKKKNNKSKGKNTKSCKPNNMFIFSKQASEDQFEIESLDGYPINKYLNQNKNKNNKGEGRRALNIKVGVDYNNSKCLNMVSGSSGGVYGEMSSEVIARFDGNKNNHILEKVEYENTGSINIEEIKHYELNSSRERQFPISINPRYKIKYRQTIMEELQQEYPYLNEKEVNFLASIVFIQRKWRQFSMWKQFEAKKNIVTEYFTEEHRISKENDWSRLIDLKEKQQTISRTKIVQFSQNQHEKSTKIREAQNQNIDHDDSQINYQTRKKTHTKISFPDSSSESQDSSHRNHTKAEGLQNQNYRQNQKEMQNTQKLESVFSMEEHKPKTENNIKSAEQSKYNWIATKQIFPEMKYLQYRRSFIRDQFEITMKLITQDYSHERISSQEFEQKKNELMNCYNFDLENLKKTKHDMKKGYLRYIDCVNKARESSIHILNQSGLRKVSSEDNFISVLYQKIYKFDTEISEWSGASKSTQLLTKKILIRKEFCRPGSDRSSNKKQRQSLNDVRSIARSSKSSFELLKSSRDMVSQGQTLLVFENTDKIDQYKSDSLSSEYRNFNNIQENPIKEFKFSNQVFKSRQSQIADQFTHSIDLKGPNKANEEVLQPKIDPEYAIMYIQDEIMMKLTKQLQCDIHEINPALVDMILIHHEAGQDHESYGGEYQENEENQSLPIMDSLNRQFESLTTPRAQLEVPDAQMDENADTIFYLRQLINFIKIQQWEQQITENMNSNQAFQAMSYLKFLRDFEVPQDQYTPIISNQKFIDWQATFINRYEVKLPRIATREEQDLFKQARAIFHRCIFQVFLGELQKNRPYGEKGRPFPWEQKYSIGYENQLQPEQLPKIMEKCMTKVDEYLIYRCGVISEKHFIGSQEDLQRMHQQNEDRIIEMLEQDLKDSPHQWYQIDEHILEMKLQLSYCIEETIFEQMGCLLGNLIKLDHIDFS